MLLVYLLSGCSVCVREAVISFKLTAVTMWCWLTHTYCIKESLFFGCFFFVFLTKTGSEPSVCLHLTVDFCPNRWFPQSWNRRLPGGISRKKWRLYGESSPGEGWCRQRVGPLLPQFTHIAPNSAGTSKQPPEMQAQLVNYPKIQSRAVSVRRVMCCAPDFFQHVVWKRGDMCKDRGNMSKAHVEKQRKHP